MSKGGSQTQTQTVDPGTQRYVDQMRQIAMGYVMPGQTAGSHVNSQLDALRGRGGMMGRVAGRFGQQGQPMAPMTPQAPQMDPALTNQYQQFAGLGNLGIGALTGGPNPFMNAHMGALNPIYNQIRAQTMQGIGDQATQAGAYGGSRQGVAQGVALGQIGQQQAASHIDAFNQSQQRALQAANLGLGASDLGRYLQEYPQMFQSRQLGLLNQGLGPYGTSQTTPMHKNVGAGVLGGAASGAAIGSAIPGVGTGIGALAGGLLGLF